MILRLAVSVEHRVVTDGRTDRHAMTANTRASYSVAQVSYWLAKLHSMASVWQFVFFVHSLTSERLNVRRRNLAVRCTVQNPRQISNLGVKGQGHRGQKTKNCRVIIPIDNA